MIDENTRLQMQLELARLDFWYFCQLLLPRFYKEDRAYLQQICEQLQGFIEDSDKHFLVLNVPPRHGKSLTAQMFTAWLFGQNNQTKVMTASYNEKLSTTFARNVRNTIATQKVNKNIVYSDIFPDSAIKYGEAQASMWALEGSNEANYLATSPTSTATGFGANYLLIDDILKSAEDAYNENKLDDCWEWFNNTFLSRTEGDWKVIIIMTRWAEGDLAGRVIKSFPNDLELITYKAVQDDGSMLCPSILSKEDYELKTKEMNEDIIQANYNQKPIDIGGRLYNEFKIWEERPEGLVRNYTDTADTGSDYLCSINYVVYENEAYITDLVFTDKPMEYTEQAVSELLYRDSVNEAVIESNNGGRGFARNVEKLLKETHNTNKTIISTQPQTRNKESRILASSAWVQNHVYMPKGWRNRFPEFYHQIMTYQRKGKNAHDDSCFPAGTKIATIRGDMNIEDIRVGDKVITPFGIKKVVNAGCTGKKIVMSKDGFTATPNHKFFNGKTFQRLDVFNGNYNIIGKRSLLKWKYRKLLYSMEQPTKLWGRESIILANQIPIRDEKIRKDFTLRFGSFITNRQFRKALKFTIKTGIALTTTLTTWSAYRLANIGGDIFTFRRQKHLKKQGLKQQNGTKAKKDESGIASRQKKTGKLTNLSLFSANSAIKNSKARFQTPNTVQNLAEAKQDTDTENEDIAQFATKTLRKKIQEQNTVLKNAKTSQIRHAEKPVEVYNLTIQDVGCYYANGALVSNCDVLAAIYEAITNDRRMQIFTDDDYSTVDRVYL